jgi:hypothetical protein
MDKTCEECERLWREHGEVTHRNFRLEERLRRAEDRQDDELVRALSAKLATHSAARTRTDAGVLGSDAIR